MPGSTLRPDFHNRHKQKSGLDGWQASPDNPLRLEGGILCRTIRTIKTKRRVCYGSSFSSFGWLLPCFCQPIISQHTLPAGFAVSLFSGGCIVKSKSEILGEGRHKWKY